MSSLMLSNKVNINEKQIVGMNSNKDMTTTVILKAFGLPCFEDKQQHEIIHNSIHIAVTRSSGSSILYPHLKIKNTAFTRDKGADAANITARCFWPTGVL